MPDRRIEVVRDLAGARQLVRAARAEGRSIGLVPTMGALHEGHAELIRRCREVCDWLAVSVFVNPTQFGPHEDLARYPRTPESDHRLCSDAGAEMVFEPVVEEVFPTGGLRSYVEVPGLSEVLEGASRPGHFRGVATVVAKLFQMIGPDVAAFGRKDFQQLAVIRRMVEDLDMPVRILEVPTVREPDGLAMSSRNRYLDPPHRRAATVLSLALRSASEAAASGERSADRVRHILRRTIESEALVALDYAEVVDADSLAPVDSIDPSRSAVALVAARVGPARLIDNERLDVGPDGTTRCD